MGVRRARLCLACSNKYTFLLMNPWQYTFYFLDLLYGSNHGFHTTHNLMVIPWHFNDILRLVFFLQICIGNTRCL